MDLPTLVRLRRAPPNGSFSGRCSGAYHAKNELQICLTNLLAGLANLIRSFYVLGHVQSRASSTCWRVIQFSMNTHFGEEEEEDSNMSDDSMTKKGD